MGIREIIFRGKEINNGWWVYGDLLTHEGFQKNEVNIRDYFQNMQCVVNSSTIGQYTGRKDKNGTKIFEGDICLCNRHIADSVDKRTFEIIFDGSWMGLSNKTYGSQISYEEFDLCEVIGNIYDNPELLDVQNSN